MILFLVALASWYVCTVALTHETSSGALFSSLSETVELRREVPLFSFAKDLQAVLEDERSDPSGNTIKIGGRPDETDAKILYGRYIESLKLYYWDRFMYQCQMDPGCNLEEAKQDSMSEFNVAASRSTPASYTETWTHADFSDELESDIDAFIERARDLGEQSGLAAADLPPLSRWDRLLPMLQPKWRRRVNWFSTKAALLALNMVQFEWARRQAVRNTEKRLAEVPEFPLL
jgi:hypothetical protein